jgi:L-amino acid N-acyltransferase YncA
MSTYRIRRARPEDMDALIALCAEHAAYERADYQPAGKAQRLAAFLFADSPRVHCLVLEDRDGRLLGYATYTLEFSTWDAEHFFHVDCLYLRDAARNRGVGWLFGKRIAQEMVDLGVPSMQFQTPPFNTPAIRIYEAMGASRKDKVRFSATRADALRFLDPKYRVRRRSPADAAIDPPLAATDFAADRRVG